MDYTALVKFIGVVGGVEVTYHAGDTSPADDAAEMNLSAKPEIASEAA